MFDAKESTMNFDSNEFFSDGIGKNQPITIAGPS
jgi:hypothetical protein